MRSLVMAGLLACASLAHGAETAQYLNVGVGGRALGMGGAYTALADDANAIYWNPAGLPGVAKREFQASHAELTQSSREDFLAYAQTTPAGTFGGAVTYLSQGQIDGRDLAGHPTGSFTASDAAVAFGYGRKTEWVDVGASVKYLQSHIGSAQAESFAVDAGVRRAIGPVQLGAAIRNVGPGLKYDTQRNDLPLRLAFGAAYKINGGHSVTAELTNGPRGAGTDVGFGGELRAVKNVYLRGGYTTQSAITGGTGFDAARGLTLGLGLRRDRWFLDYAAVPMGELGSTHRFSLGVSW